ncbi:MAG: hypothetical protein AAGJ37_03655 [Pseudomonadota bacterium]
MPRKMSLEKEKEFEELSLFIEYFSTHCYGIDRNDPVRPSNVLVKITERFGKSKALQGLKQAVNDCIEASSEMDLASIKDFDRQLRKQGIITFSAIRKKYWSKYKRILKRGQISNETEYYLVKGLLSDLESEISEEERDVLSGFVVSFEERI